MLYVDQLDFKTIKEFIFIFHFIIFQHTLQIIRTIITDNDNSTKLDTTIGIDVKSVELNNEEKAGQDEEVETNSKSIYLSAY